MSGNVIRKPSYGNFTAVVDCGFNLMHSSLLEMRRGHGIVLFCQLDVTSRYGKDPAATMLTDNILKEMTNRYLPVGPQRVAYVGGDEGAKLLDRMGMQYQRLTPKNRWEIGSAQVVILGAGAEKELLESVGQDCRQDKLDCGCRFARGGFKRIWRQLENRQKEYIPRVRSQE